MVLAIHKSNFSFHFVCDVFSYLHFIQRAMIIDNFANSFHAKGMFVNENVIRGTWS